MRFVTGSFLCACAIVLLGVSIVPRYAGAQELRMDGAALATRVAPGALLPLTVRLSNFGSNERVDVSIQYEIVDETGLVIAAKKETVAVQTTASFTTQILLPNSISPGVYTAQASLIYDGQHAPAIASQKFTVAPAIFGIFVSDAVTYLAIAFITTLLLVLFALLLRRHQRQTSFVPIDYSNIPYEERVYFEIISDVIQQMRYHKGDAAVRLVADVPGLVINAESGRVVALKRSPSEISAAVIGRYEKTFGKHVNLSFLNDGKTRAIIR